MKKICEFCKEEFSADRKTRKFCSIKCRTNSRTTKSLVNCSFCGEEVEKTKFDLKRSKNFYCNSDCKSKHQKIILKGDKNPNFKNKTIKVKCSNCNEIMITAECLIKNGGGVEKKNIYCSKKCKYDHQRKILIGENNPNYKKEKTEEERVKERQYTGYSEWRTSVFKRDGYRCVCCNTNTTRKNKLVAHHILNHYKYPELRIDIDNGVTLCSKCHWEFHKIYGTLNNNLQQLKEFLNIKKAS